MKQNVLITGGTGLLAPYVVDAFSGKESVFTTSRTSEQYPCELTDEASVKSLIERLEPAIIIHLAALTNVDYCENHPEEARKINILSTSHIVKTIQSSDCYLIYISTDQVYPETDGPFSEDQADPVNVYATTKLLAEEEVLKHSKSLIARTNIFGPSRTPGRQSLSDFFIEAFTHNRPVNMFSDIYFSPLLMATLGRLLRKCSDQHLTGIYNVGSRNGLSKKEFALEIARHKGLSTTHAQACKGRELEGRARRPYDMRMNVAKLENSLSESMPDLVAEINKL